jgi:hypothetical protein
MFKTFRCVPQHQPCPLGAGWRRGTHATRAVGTGEQGCACVGVGVGGSEQTVNRLEGARLTHSRALAMAYAVRCAYIGAGSYPCIKRAETGGRVLACPRAERVPSSTRRAPSPVHARARTVNLLGQLDHRRRRARLPLPVVYLRDRVTLSLSARMV